jgi:hypothetical protein
LNVLNTSTGTGGNNYTFGWGVSVGITINKTNSNNDGEYVILNNFENENFKQDITLTGTTPVQIGDFSFYDKKSGWVRIVSTVSGSPCAIFSFSKNSNTRAGNITRYSSTGIISGTNLNLTWNINSGLFLNKTNGNYNGVYTATFISY